MFAGDFEQDFDDSPEGARFLVMESEMSGRGLGAIPQWRTELRRRIQEARSP